MVVLAAGSSSVQILSDQYDVIPTINKSVQVYKMML